MAATLTLESHPIINFDDVDHFNTPGIYNPPKKSQCTQIECSVKPENIGKLIGQKGKIFNAITRCARVDYIWINNDKNVIEIWGPQIRHEDAKLRLIKRMQLIEANSK
jgi:polyribonucleotide nucleotidyltransferase